MNLTSEQAFTELAISYAELLIANRFLSREVERLMVELNKITTTNSDAP